MATRKSRRALSPLSRLQQAMLALPETGPEGFEGFVRDCLEEFLALPFRLAKSGPQGGGDGKTTDRTDGIAFEAKRYQQDSRLGLDDLKKKVADATANDTCIWLLAATKEVADQDARQLEAFGDSLGVAVRVLDWRTKTAAPLACLVANSPRTVGNWFKGDAAIAVELAVLARDPDFDRISAWIRTSLSEPDVGLETLRRHALLWSEETTKSRTASMSRIGQPIDFGPSSERVIRRAAIFDQLDAWWVNPAEGPAVLIGDERMGKSWAAFQWAIAKGRDGGPVPLIISARRFVGHHLIAGLAEALEQRFHKLTAAHWQTRLRRWLRHQEGSSRILVVIDGLNENWARDWHDIVQEAAAPELACNLRLLLTDRPDDFRTQRGGFASLTPPPRKITVSKFTDAERLELLTRRGRSLSSFPAPVRDLLCNPGLAERALDHFEEHGNADFLTAERLMLEDWRAIASRSPVRLSDQEFSDLIAGVARDWLATRQGDDGVLRPIAITRADLVGRITADSGFAREEIYSDLSAIVNGLWLQPTGKPHQFNLRSEQTPFALGFLLLSELRELAGANLIARLNRFMDPQNGGDDAVSALRCAAAFAIYSPDASHELKLALISRWLEERNFSTADFEVLWRLASDDAEAFLDVLERLWLACTLGGAADEVSIKAVVNAAGKPSFAKALRARLIKWLSWYWLDSEEGEFLGRYDGTTERAMRSRDRTKMRATLWKHSRAAADWAITESTSGRGASWLSHRAAGILSFLPRAPYAECYGVWAISRAIMENPRHLDEIAWCLRYNTNDREPAERELGALVDRLAGYGDRVASLAADYLAAAMQTGPRAMIGKDAQSRLWPKIDIPKVYSLNGDEITLRAPPEGAHNTSFAVISRASFLSTFAVNPALRLNPADASRLEVAGDALSGEPLWRGGRGGRTLDDTPVEDAAAFLSRWLPQTRARLVREAFADAANRNERDAWRLTREVNANLLLFTAESGDALHEAGVRLLQGGGTMPEENWQAFTLPALLARSSLEQIRFLETTPLVEKFLVDSAGILERLSVAAVERIREHISPSRPAKERHFWLGILGAVRWWPEQPLGSALADCTQEADTKIREQALRAILVTNDVEAADIFKNSGWRLTPEMSADERRYGSSIIGGAIDESDVTDGLARIDAEAAARILERFPHSPPALDAYERLVETALAPAKRHAIMSRAPQVDAMREFAMQRPEKMLAWAQNILSEDVQFRALHSALERFPVHQLVETLLEQAPATGVELWEKLAAAFERGFVKSESFDMLPISANVAEPARRLRNKVLDNAVTDQRLQTIAVTAQRAGCIDWLIGKISADWDTGVLHLRARGLVLAGCLERSEATLELWKKIDADDIASAWLDWVRSKARHRFDRHQWAIHWFESFARADNDVDAFTSLDLFHHCLDYRTMRWASDAYELVKESLGNRRRKHFIFSLEAA
jgi:hypothetical protein